MDTRRSYRETAQGYAEGVRGLFTPAPAAVAERGAAALTAGEDLAERAERLAAQSGDLTQAALARLLGPGADDRVLATTELLAKALSDLQVSTLLYQAALDEEGGQTPTALAQIVVPSGGVQSPWLWRTTWASCSTRPGQTRPQRCPNEVGHWPTRRRT